MSSTNLNDTCMSLLFQSSDPFKISNFRINGDVLSQFYGTNFFSSGEGKGRSKTWISHGHTYHYYAWHS